ncbi:hypothetical protein [Mesorhizobium shangrilense]|uniref:ABC transporter ATP-binding protein n=1 Tax=Mesorhizobium shangrilense TaxID=460060 RepID=A0ABV2DQV3_9HYPH
MLRQPSTSKRCISPPASERCPAYCGELITLKDGKLLTRGTPDQIMQGDVLKGIFGVEMSVFAHPVTGQPIGYVQ